MGEVKVTYGGEMERILRKGMPGVLLVLDTFAIISALYIAYIIRFYSGWFAYLPSTQAAIAVGPERIFYGSFLPLTLFWLIVFTMRGLYRQKVLISRWDEIVEIFKGVLVGIIILFGVLFEVKDPFPPTQSVLLIYGGSLFLFVGTIHFVIRSLQKELRRRGYGLWETIIVGFNLTGKKLAQQLIENPAWGFKILGFIFMKEGESLITNERLESQVDLPIGESKLSFKGSEPSGGDALNIGRRELSPSKSIFIRSSPLKRDHLSRKEQLTGSLSVLGNLEDLPRVVKENRLEWVLIAPEENERHEELMEVLNRCWASAVRVMLVADYYQMVVGVKGTIHIHGLPLLEVLPRIASPMVLIFKRILDILVALVMSFMVILLIPLIGLAIKIDSPGPIFYTQKRVGRRGKEFTLIKFRSMVKDAEKISGAVWAKPDDPRVTRVGKVLRRFHLDELPQFFNVLLGHMSLIGPRPERRELVERMSHLVPLYERRLSVRPGMTGWAQIRYKYDESVEDVKEKTRYDLYYIDNLSLSLDLKIILITMWQIVKGTGR